MYFLTADVGILGPIAYLFGLLMNFIYDILRSVGIGNIGLSIIIFTLITRIILYPLTIKQQKSSKLMSIIQPEIRSIQKKYEGKKDNASMLAQQSEVKAVYEKYGTSMTGGCLQLLIQMPIIFALYRVIINIPAYVNHIRQLFETIIDNIGGISALPKITEFANGLEKKVQLTGAIKDFIIDGKIGTLTAEAQKNFIIDFLYKLKPEQYGDFIKIFPNKQQELMNCFNEINNANSFLGLNLATAPSDFGFSPNFYWLIPILAFITQYLSAKFMQTNNSKIKTDAEDQVAQSMKTMNVMLPLMSAFFCFGFATGIGVYWIASSLFMMIQQIIVNKQMEKINMDELIKQNIEKANAKRLKKGLPPLSPQSSANNLKKMEERAEKEQKEREKIMENSSVKTKKAQEYYFNEVEEDSLFARANMVKKYNEKNNKK